MFESLTAEGIKRDIIDALGTDIDTREGSYTNDLISPVALELWKLYQTLDGLLPVVYVDETSGAYIDRRCAYYGITRKAGVKARVTLSVSGADGAAVPAGAVFLTVSGLRYAVTEAGVVSGGSVELEAEAAEEGAVYNVGTGQIVRQLSSIAGVTAVTNPEAAQGGADAESDAALVARLYTRLQSPATSGNADHYRQWALEVEGVGAAKVTPLADGPGTVSVLIAGAGMGPVDAETVTRCADYIETLRPVGAEVTVETVEGLPIDVSAALTLDASTTHVAVAEAFTAALAAYLQSISFAQYTVPYSRIGYLLAGVDGVLDYSGLTVNGGTVNITVAAKQVPQVGTVTLI